MARDEAFCTSISDDRSRCIRGSSWLSVIGSVTEGVGKRAGEEESRGGGEQGRRRAGEEESRGGGEEYNHVSTQTWVKRHWASEVPQLWKLAV